MCVRNSGVEHFRSVKILRIELLTHFHVISSIPATFQQFPQCASASIWNVFCCCAKWRMLYNWNENCANVCICSASIDSRINEWRELILTLSLNRADDFLYILFPLSSDAPRLQSISLIFFFGGNFRVHFPLTFNFPKLTRHRKCARRHNELIKIELHA